VRRLLKRGTRADGQALVEMALYLPLMLAFAMFCLQMALVFFAYLSVLNAARDVGRWLAVHPHTVDATAIATIRSRLPSGLDASALSIDIAPTCLSLVNNQCANRPVGARLAVTMDYDLAPHLFLPTSFQLGDLAFSLPTRLPPYTLNMAVEPS
jgi:Flp pilus assembly protein TadG